MRVFLICFGTLVLAFYVFMLGIFWNIEWMPGTILAALGTTAATCGVLNEIIPYPPAGDDDVGE